MNTPNISKPVKGVISEYNSVSHCSGVHQGFVTEGGEGLVAVNNGDSLAFEDGSDDGKRSVDGGECVLHSERSPGDVVDFESARHVSDSRAVPVSMRHHHNLQSSPQIDFTGGRKFRF